MSIPNLVATTTSSRCLPSDRPSSSSLAPTPYVSEVSKKVMPASSAASTTRWVCSASIRAPKAFVPSPMVDTISPLVPRGR